ncbi:hypothetical protein JTE90_024011 [Oedothorax gibbosus]|uniref:Uncharacterized protein n=1 Tax=Oedothorax gibbosus TaxID=931172 RepID=A0AAV6VAF8_9ARAC|nr:hypothetical protein JTE90_024011 [Oedothorax gibbosus]
MPKQNFNFHLKQDIIVQVISSGLSLNYDIGYPDHGLTGIITDIVAFLLDKDDGTFVVFYYMFHAKLLLPPFWAKSNRNLLPQKMSVNNH